MFQGKIGRSKLKRKQNVGRYMHITVTQCSSSWVSSIIGNRKFLLRDHLMNWLQVTHEWLLTGTHAWGYIVNGKWSARHEKPKHTPFYPWTNNCKISCLTHTMRLVNRNVNRILVLKFENKQREEHWIWIWSDMGVSFAAYQLSCFWLGTWTH